MTMHDVFISYSSHDKEAADAVCAYLEQQGLRCWVAPRNIPPGREWGQAIVEGIEQCKVMVMVLSRHSNESVQVRREIERAIGKGRAVIPFRIEKVLPTKAMEYYLSATHWLDAFTPPLHQHLPLLAACVSDTIAGRPHGPNAMGKWKPSGGRRVGVAVLLCAVLGAVAFTISHFIPSRDNAPGTEGKSTLVAEPSVPDSKRKYQVVTTELMTVQVDGTERTLPMMPADELAKLRREIPEIKTVNRAFRLDLTSQDVGKRITGVEFEARNRLGVNLVLYQSHPCLVSMMRIEPTKSNWRAAIASAELFEVATGFFKPAKFIGTEGYQLAASGNYVYLLPPGSAVRITQMKKDSWIMMSDPGKDEDEKRPVYAILCASQHFTAKDDPPTPDVEAVLAFYKL